MTNYPLIIYSGFLLAVAAVGIATSVVLWFVKRFRHDGNTLLCLSLFFLSACLGLSVVSDRFPLYAMILSRSADVSWLIYAPLTFFYLQATTEGKPVRFIDAFHFIPVMVFIAWSLPFFSFGEAQTFFNTSDLNGFFTSGFHGWLKHLVLAFYWALQVLCCWKFLNVDVRARQVESKAWRRWILVYLALQFLIFAPYYLSSITGGSTMLSLIPALASAAVICVAVFTVWRNPGILYGLDLPTLAGRPSLSEQALVVALLDDDRGKIIKGEFDIRKGEEVLEQLISLMEEDRPYLLKRYSLEDLAHELKLPAHQVSALMKRVVGLSVADYIDQQRIFYCQERMKKGNASHLTLAELSAACGFTDLNTFTKAFLKFTATDPDTYRRSLKKITANG